MTAFESDRLRVDFGNWIFSRVEAAAITAPRIITSSFARSNGKLKIGQASATRHRGKSAARYRKPILLCFVIRELERVRLRSTRTLYVGETAALSQSAEDRAGTAPVH